MTTVEEQARSMAEEFVAGLQAVEPTEAIRQEWSHVLGRFVARLFAMPAQVLDPGEIRRFLASLGRIRHSVVLPQYWVLAGGSAPASPEPRTAEGLFLEFIQHRLCKGGDVYSILLQQGGLAQPELDLLDQTYQAVLARLRLDTKILGFELARRLVDAVSEDRDEAPNRALLRRAYFALQPGEIRSGGHLLCLVLASPDPWIRLDIEHLAREVLPSESGGQDPHDDWQRLEATSAADNAELTLAGRIGSPRRHKQHCFAHLSTLKDRIQLVFEGDQDTGKLRDGDVLRVSGTLGTTRTGERSLFVKRILYHAPNRFPSVDIAAERRALALDSNVLTLTRRFWSENGFCEVNANLLTRSFEGGGSRSYSTWEASSEQDLYLPVTSELHLLRAVGLGMTRCYAVSTSYRNEDSRHGLAHREFSLLEAYGSDLSLDEMTDLSSRFIATVLGRTGEPPYRVESFAALFSQQLGLDPDDLPALIGFAKGRGIEFVEAMAEKGRLAVALFQKYVQPKMKGIVALAGIPSPASPLIAGEGAQARRLWIYVDGTDVAEVAGNEISLERIQARLEKQFSGDRFAVLRDYREHMRTFAMGLPPVVGVGVALMRLEWVIDPSVLLI